MWSLDSAGMNRLKRAGVPGGEAKRNYAERVVVLGSLCEERRAAKQAHLQQVRC